MNKIVFLDIDGVLVIRSCFSKPLVRGFWLGPCQPFDLNCVRQLNRITATTGADIVVSSTWRHGNEERFLELKKFLRTQGVNAKVLGRTPNLNTFRGLEIQKWMKDNSWEGNIVILDDDEDMDVLVHRLVKTDMIEGLTPRLADRVISMLGEI